MVAERSVRESLRTILRQLVRCARRAGLVQSEDSEENILKWKRLIKRVRKVRFLQRVFAYTGHHLSRSYSRQFLDSVKKT
jgi:hypothetical protein